MAVYDWGNYRQEEQSIATGRMMGAIRDRLGIGYSESAARDAALAEVVEALFSLDVSGYGAVGDGVTDDTNAIQGAIDVAAARGGGMVFIPDGTYKLTRQSNGVALLVDADDVVLVLAPNAVLQLTTTALSCSVVFFGSLTNAAQRHRCGMFGGKIDCNGSTDPKGVLVGWTRNAFVRGVEISNLGGTGTSSASGIKVLGKDATDRAQNWFIEDCYIHDIPGDAVSDGVIAVYADRGTLAHNRITITGRGLFLNGPTLSCSIIDNHVYAVTDNGIRVSALSGGVALTDLLDHTMVGNTIDGAAIDGIRLNGRGIVCAKNTVRNCLNRGIKAEALQDSVISDNTVHDCTNEGIMLARATLAELTGAFARNIIASNTVWSNGGSGVRIQGGGYTGTDLAFGNRISGNTCYLNAVGGVECEDVDAQQILNNLCYNNAVASGAKQGIYVEQTLALTAAYGVEVAGNRCFETRGSGDRQTRGIRIIVTHASAILNGVVIDGNNLSGTTTTGIELSITGTLGPVTIRDTLADTVTTAISGNRTTDLVTGTSTAYGTARRPGSQVLGRLLGANMNVTTDQAIPITTANYVIERIVVTNASLNLTTAAGGVYTAASKGGTAVVAAAQAYSALTAATKQISLTLADTDRRTATTLYLSLTTGQGAAATADVYVLGYALD